MNLKPFLRLTALVILCVVLFGCEKEPGSIYGVVTDFSTGEPVANANVQLRPNGETTLTGSDGMYEFLDVPVGDYSITVSKLGYTDLVDDYVIKVMEGKKVKRDVQIEKRPSVLHIYDNESHEITELDFGADEGVTKKTFNIFNKGTQRIDYTIEKSVDWIANINKPEGTINTGETKPIVVTIDRRKLAVGDNTTSMLITSSVDGGKELIVKARNNGKLPTVSILEVIDIDSVTYRVKCEVVSDGGLEVTERGICWNTYGDPTMDDETILYASGGTGLYTIRMEHLSMATHYYVRAYAKNHIGTAISEVLDFVTGAIVTPPTVKTVEVHDVTATSAVCKGNVTDDGGTDLIERGVCWGTSANPTTSGQHQAASQATTGEFSVSITGLNSNTTYHVRAYAKNSRGTSYGQDLSFTTTEGLPKVTTASVTNITATSAKGGGTVTDQGASAVTERGICWSTSHNPTMESSHANSGTGAGSFTVNMTGLTPNKTYYVRAYAKNQQGTAYGSEVSFKALEGLPVVTTSNITEITSTTAKGGGNVTDQGGSAVAERGICWSTDPNPTLSDSHANSGTGTGSFTVNMTDLIPGTKYYVRAYATNTQGTTYGEQKEFTTGVNKPTLTTATPTDITPTTAKAGGEVTDNGGAEVTERGVCWGTSHNPTTSGSHASSGSDSDIFSVNITGLTPSTMYYVRAYAKNSAGTGYGDEVSFISESLPVYTVSVSADPSEGGTVTGGGSYQQGKNCTVKATPNTGYTFLKWTKDGEQVATTAQYSFKVEEECSLVAHFQKASYTVTVSANPSNCGTVTGGGTYEYGESCTVTATANDGFEFVKWTESGNQVSTDATYTFTVSGNRTLVAQFQIKTYTITTSSNPTEGGTTSGGGSYQNGKQCTVTARANEGFNFVNWTENDSPVSSNMNYSFTVACNRTLKANFTAHNYSVSAIANPTEGGTLTGSGGYDYGQVCTLTATANEGYVFVNWTKNGTEVSTNASYSFTVIESASYVAHFQARVYNITTNPDPIAGGTVSGSGSYTHGQSCVLTAIAAAGYTFVNWTKDGTEVSTNTSYSFTVIESATYVAHFQAQTYNITANANPVEGTVSGGGSFTYGQTCTLTAVANEGYTFVNWIKNGIEVSTNASYSFTVIESATYVAHFQAQTYNITVNANPVEGGTVSGGGSFNYGQTCTLTAVANEGYTFVNWTQNDISVSPDASFSFVVTDNFTLVANFSIHNYTITASANPINGGTVNGGGSYNHGQTCVLTATAANGYDFVRWTKNGAEVSTETMYSFTVMEAASYVAQFQAKNYTITLNADPMMGGSVSGGGSYTHGQNCTVVATAISGYIFVNWTEEGQQVSIDASYTFQVTGNRTLVAHFTNAPIGAINGVFTVGPNDSDKVFFSKGNLQYVGSSNLWKFADNQWVVIGDFQANSEQGSTRDLFGWGTSGYNHGAVCYQPWHTSGSGQNYWAYGNNNYNLYDQSGMADWGYNAISNGGNQENSGWRILTWTEWVYVFNTRNTSSGARFIKARLNGVNGVILFPDGWDSSIYTLNYINSTYANYNTTIINETTWNTYFEPNGCVFLPAAGYRSQTSVYNLGSDGYYWSASGDGTQSAFRGVDFHSSLLYLGESEWRNRGLSVRLVRNVQ